MLSYLRRQVNQLCSFANDQFTPSFGEAPATQAFGDVASEGTSTNIARADHVHGMPDLDSFVLDLETHTMYLNELMNLTNNTNIMASGSVTFGGHDDAGNTGGFGTVNARTGAANNAGAGVWVAQSSTLNDTTLAIHPWKRTSIFQTRVRPAQFGQLHATPELFSCTTIVGGFRTSTNNRADLVVDGVYFFASLDAAGAGNWIARATSNSNTTSVDTGITPVVNADNTVAFQTFRIQWDGTTASYFIDGTSYAEITTNIPPVTRKLAGFGCLLTNGNPFVTQRTIIADYFAIAGTRVYSE